MSMLNKKQYLPLSRLATAIAVACSVSGATSALYAMESISEQAMSDVTGADGVSVNIQASQVSFDNLYWKDAVDNAATPTTLQLQLNQATASTVTANAPIGSVTLKPNGGSTINANLQINAGSNAGTPALNLNFTVSSPLIMAAPRIEICANTASCTANNRAPSLAFTTQSTTSTPATGPIQFALTTTNGFLNSAGTANVTILLDSANAFLTTSNYNTSGTVTSTNQIVVSDIRANINANGKIWVDATDGFRFNGAVNLIAASSSRSGIQLSMMLQSLDTSNPTKIGSGAGGFMRFGASGSLPVTDLYLRGTKATGTEDNLGSIVGAQGIAARLVAEIQRGTGSDGFQLDFGAAGTGTATQDYYGIRMVNFVPFSNVSSASTTNAKIDTGNVYLNIAPSGANLTMPQQSAFTSGSSPLFSPTTLANDYGLKTSDFSQTLSNDSVVLAVRGLSIQGVPLQTYFNQNYNASNGTGGPIDIPNKSASGFALMPVLYGVNANLTLSSSSTKALGYTMALATTGNNGVTSTTTDAGIQSTSLFLADTSSAYCTPVATCTPKNNSQYLGFRDIDYYFQASGEITLTNDHMRISMPNFMMNLSGGIAGGYLPGAEPTGYKKYADPANTDTFFKLNIKLQSGDATNNSKNYFGFNTLTPSALGINGDITLAGSGPTDAAGIPDQTKATSFIRFVEPIVTGTTQQGSALGFDKITGRFQFIDGSQIAINKDSGVYTANVVINPGATIGTGVRGSELLTSLDFYPQNGASQALGKLVVTGMTMNNVLTIKPVLR